jgi:queuine/archaeosine tRNA-ribosyltransferase
MHNVTYYQGLMRQMRAAIAANAFGTFAVGVLGEEMQACPA